ncbi:MAG: hypothetical protein V1746_03300 [bacterium]
MDDFDRAMMGFNTAPPKEKSLLEQAKDRIREKKEKQRLKEGKKAATAYGRYQDLLSKKLSLKQHP